MSAMPVASPVDPALPMLDDALDPDRATRAMTAVKAFAGALVRVRAARLARLKRDVEP